MTNGAGRRMSIIVGAAGAYAVAVAGAMTWLRVADGPRLIVFVIGMGAATVAMVVYLGLFIRSLVGLSRSDRPGPVRFVVDGGVFRVPQVIDMRWVVVANLLLAGPVLGGLGSVAVEGGALGLIVVTPVVVLTGVAIALLWWLGRAPGLRLTPNGVDWEAKIFRRHIPWEALAPGGPPRPRRGAQTLRLGVLRPDLVTQRGLGLGAGSREAPLIPARMDIHPGFLADAIRWYAEHPEDRAAIGTPPEHERLLGVLGGPAPDHAAEPAPSPPAPGLLRAATWLTIAGVASAAVLAGAQLVLAVAYRSEIDAIESADIAEDGQTAGGALVTSGDLAILQTALSLVLALAVGTAAVVLLRSLWRRADGARITLAVLAGAAIVWSLCPIGSPVLSLTESDSASAVGALVMLGWMGGNGAVVCLAATALALLLTGPVARYTRA